MGKQLWWLMAGPALLLGCTDGPEQIFTPFEGDRAANNTVPGDGKPWVVGTDQTYSEDAAGGDNVGRAKFCTESETTELIQRMVQAPIIPDVAVGLVGLWSNDGGSVRADDLVGRPEDGKFCDPTEIYLDAFTWGPTQEVIVFFNQDTRLVESIIAYQQYLGALEAEVTVATSTAPVKMVAKPRERVRIGSRILNQYASRAQAPNAPNSWLNPTNVTAIYGAIRETFFDAAPLPAGYDCVATQVCDIIYTSANEAAPQTTGLIFQDSGVILVFNPDGTMSYIQVEPVRSAPFETGANLSFAPSTSSTVAFTFRSTTRPDCILSLNDQSINWGEFRRRCIASGDERSLDRVNYTVETARDALQVEFTGVDLGFVRETSTQPVFRDADRPVDTDVLYSIGFTRTLPAAVDEFRPRTLANSYRTKLAARLRSAIVATGTSTPINQHPFWNFQIVVPFTADEPQRIGELLDPSGESWIPQVLATVRATYQSMNAEQKAMVDQRIFSDVYLVEPFVDAVLEAFTHGRSQRAGTFKAFRTTDDARWSIGYAHFIQNGQMYRVQAQYSLNFGAVTAVFVERGGSEMDEFLNALNDIYGTGPYYDMSLAFTGPFALGSSSIRVRDFDRQLDTLDIQVSQDFGGALELTVSGDPLQDRNGYLRQIRGERYEFVPAHVVRLYGKETFLAVWVREDRTIGRVSQSTFKGTVTLCEGLDIAYGDDVRALLNEWVAKAGQGAFQDCEIVYNYSSNRNLLTGVASLKNRAEVLVVDGRAVTAAVWE